MRALQQSSLGPSHISPHPPPATHLLRALQQLLVPRLECLGLCLRLPGRRLHLDHLRVHAGLVEAEVLHRPTVPVLLVPASEDKRDAS